MRRIFNVNLLAIACALLLFFSGCKQEIAIVITSPATKIGAMTAVCGGKITFEGQPKFTSYGICWDTKANPTITKIRTAHNGIISGQFENALSGLTPKTIYFVRAYATNSAGTAYGEQVSFTTTISVPVVITSFISDITFNSATVGSIILFNGGSNIRNYGICWDTLPHPTIATLKTVDSFETDVFLGHLSGLKSNKSYFIRAYATNSAGTAYGEEKTFTTIKGKPSLITTIILDISLNAANCGMKIISDGGSDITEHGICWNTKTDPTIDNSKTTKSYAPGKFRMTGLNPSTQYYVRAYATNSTGTGYGTLLSFRTTGNPPSAETLDAINISTTGAILRAIVNANKFDAQITFEFGKTTEYDHSIPIPQNPVTGSADMAISLEISGLEAGTKYHFRVKASNATGKTNGKDMIFTTSTPIAPTLTNFNPIHKNYNDTAFIITPPASNSSGSFTYTSSNPQVATIRNNKVRIMGSGNSVITATLASAGNFTSGSITTTLTMNLSDFDGNVYNTVAIGTQDWMKENLKVTRYRDGTPIANISDNKEWKSLTEGAYCWYNNDPANSKNTNGALYNWYAVANPRNLCPDGWHVPADADWKTLELFLGMTAKQTEGTVKRSPGKATKIKNASGWINQEQSTNTSEFSAIAAGYRSFSTGEFFNLGLDGCWWTATEDKENSAWLRNVYYYLNDIYRISDNKKLGFSVRCIRDK